MSSTDPKAENVKRTAISAAMDWGKNPLPPTLLATLVTALHARPFQPLPMLFPPVLLFSTYLNLSSYPVDSAGVTAAWSGLYLLLASRRKVAGASFGRRLGSTFGARGFTRGAAMALAGVNVMGCGITYAFGKRETGKDADGKVV
ncbi:hypothetical protein BJ875DRAFT_451009 [Amylocarpus encephaloides]|uniref:Altered inheritance of mitochondria protein 19 n=1 Tax=Amylocarpus encephaloides TaxID=45428 RepID=A0A9P7YRI1_9HELO|nr:hypothetical protein BJ875DRAFT_451009 [Amylocarpus encephaloides]